MADHPMDDLAYLVHRMRQGTPPRTGNPQTYIDIDLLHKGADEIERLLAELTELRALKAKVDSVVCHGSDAIVYLPGQKLPIAYAGSLIDWLRETAEPPRPSLDSLLAGTEFEGQLDD